ncbi:MAG: endo alpha-1,4 polygalactosaminidase [Bacteroidales bacterium]|jgi:cysteinyl-tRNA synthetase|nr:endo alpha-1,4 polygalactosaminidase [Bacteroidales bacterium]
MINKIILIQIIPIIFISCNKDDNLDYKQEMRDFVTGISDYAKASDTKFIIIPQNGIELVTSNGEEGGSVQTEYLTAIDGNGQEDLFFGYDNDDQATSASDNSYLKIFLDISKNAGKTILVTDYCSSPSKMVSSYNQNNAAGYISFAASQRELNNIPDYPMPIYGENNGVITTLSEVKNFLYLINPENYSTRTDFINSVTSTNYDLLIMDFFFQDGTEFTATEITRLKSKVNGGKRLVISYMSIGEAEDYRYYWQSSWGSEKPSWIDRENPDWEGNYKVKYWEGGWQNIIFGNENSYLRKIINASFDGVYLDIIDAFEYFE